MVSRVLTNARRAITPTANAPSYHATYDASQSTMSRTITQRPAMRRTTVSRDSRRLRAAGPTTSIVGTGQARRNALSCTASESRTALATLARTYDGCDDQARIASIACGDDWGIASRKSAYTTTTTTATRTPRRRTTLSNARSRELSSAPTGAAA